MNVTYSDIAVYSPLKKAQVAFIQYVKYVL